jgi:hypothetical protein
MYINHISLIAYWHLIYLSAASFFLKKHEIGKDLPTSLYHPESPLFAGSLKREVFLKQVTQHLTQHVTFFDVNPQ